ncbi:MAG: hypothetical protein ACE5H8_15150 [Alphaproteobacteria bacterium]
MKTLSLTIAVAALALGLSAPAKAGGLSVALGYADGGFGYRAHSGYGAHYGHRKHRGYGHFYGHRRHYGHNYGYRQRRPYGHGYGYGHDRRRDYAYRRHYRPYPFYGYRRHDHYGSYTALRIAIPVSRPHETHDVARRLSAADVAHSVNRSHGVIVSAVKFGDGLYSVWGQDREGRAVKLVVDPAGGNVLELYYLG